MKHIRQKDSVGTNSYTVVVLDGWDKPLEEHPSVMEHPELFEIADCDLPDYIQYVLYSA
jgi:hypothetical protein